jgi:hypothetical protein
MAPAEPPIAMMRWPSMIGLPAWRGFGSVGKDPRLRPGIQRVVLEFGSETPFAQAAANQSASWREIARPTAAMSSRPKRPMRSFRRSLLTVAIWSAMAFRCSFCRVT